MLKALRVMQSVPLTVASNWNVHSYPSAIDQFMGFVSSVAFDKQCGIQLVRSRANPTRFASKLANTIFQTDILVQFAIIFENLAGKPHQDSISEYHTVLGILLGVLRSMTRAANPSASGNYSEDAFYRFLQIQLS